VEPNPQPVERALAATRAVHCHAHVEAPHRCDACGGWAARATCAGFTLIEMAAALAIAGLLAVMAAPAFHEWLGAYELANYAKHLAETMTRARTEAVRRGHRVNLCKSLDRERCADQGNWSAGFLVFVDINRDGKIDDGEPVLEIEGSAPRGITVSANRPVDDYVSYTNLGQARMLNGALQMGTFIICRRGQRALHVVLANTGRVRLEKASDRCL
jgi:type IV fimbrial biogenesis protein FimT